MVPHVTRRTLVKGTNVNVLVPMVEAIVTQVTFILNDLKYFQMCMFETRIFNLALANEKFHLINT